jgi:DNA-binding transcriptional MerR regulator
MVQDLTIEDLSKKSGLSLRTLRYYIQEDLLPGPDTAGKYASYSQLHLDHLTLIKRLKQLHLPLKEIRLLLSNMTSTDMKYIIEYQDSVNLNLLMNEDVFGQFASIPDKNSSALDYIRNLEKNQNRLRRSIDSPKSPSPGRISKNRTIQETPENYRSNQERWTKIILFNGLELNVKEQQARKYKVEFDTLIKFAEKLFKK